MTGIDLLRAEMEKRGACKAQIESKTATMVLDILTEANGKYSDLAQLDSDIKAYRQELMLKQFELEQIEAKLEIVRYDLDTAKSETLNYIKEFNKALTECETAEGRDAMRRAQVFINSVNIENSANNTYFIQGLAMVMAGYPMGNITRFEKVEVKE